MLLIYWSLHQLLLQLMCSLHPERVSATRSLLCIKVWGCSAAHPHPIPVVLQLRARLAVTPWLQGNFYERAGVGIPAPNLIGQCLQHSYFSTCPHAQLLEPRAHAPPRRVLP